MLNGRDARIKDDWIGFESQQHGDRYRPAGKIPTMRAQPCLFNDSPFPTLDAAAPAESLFNLSLYFCPGKTLKWRLLKKTSDGFLLLLLFLMKEIEKRIMQARIKPFFLFGEVYAAAAAYSPSTTPSIR